MTGEHCRDTATAPAYDLVLAVRRRRLRYIGHVCNVIVLYVMVARNTIYEFLIHSGFN